MEKQVSSPELHIPSFCCDCERLSATQFCSSGAILRRTACDNYSMVRFIHQVRIISKLKGFRYISAIFLLVPFALLTSQIYDEERHILSQSYYYALIAGTIYSIISTFLLLNVIGASSLSISVAGGVELLVLRKRYDASFKILSIAQRSIMLQTISFVLYVALMAGVFSAVEGWSFVDALYWVDYTLLTIGLGELDSSHHVNPY